MKLKDLIWAGVAVLRYLPDLIKFIKNTIREYKEARYKAKIEKNKQVLEKIEVAKENDDKESLLDALNDLESDDK